MMRWRDYVHTHRLSVFIDNRTWASVTIAQPCAVAIIRSVLEPGGSGFIATCDGVLRWKSIHKGWR